MSRRKSSADIGAVQSRLSTRIAGYAAHAGSDPSKSRNGRTRSLIRSTFAAVSSLVLSTRSARRPRVTDEAGRPADQADDLVPGALQAAQHDELDEVAEVQRRGRRVESAIRRDRSAREGLAQRGLVGGLRHRSAPLQLVEDVAHGTGFPSGRRCGTDEPLGVSTKTGISRVVRSAYRAKFGQVLSITAQSSSRSLPCARRALIGVSRPRRVTMASPAASRLVAQAGIVSPPQLDPATSQPVPWGTPSSGTLRGCPLRRPTTVRVRSGRPVIDIRATRPPDSRYSPLSTRTTAGAIRGSHVDDPMRIAARRKGFTRQSVEAFPEFQWTLVRGTVGMAG
jgi:hypothetical protein